MQLKVEEWSGLTHGFIFNALYESRFLSAQPPSTAAEDLNESWTASWIGAVPR